MFEIKRDENGKRHFYVSSWLYVTLGAILGSLYGLAIIGLTSVISAKVLIVITSTWFAGYYGMDIMRKKYMRDIQVFWEEYRFFRTFRMAWRITVIRHKVRKVLNSGNLDAIRAELDAS